MGIDLKLLASNFRERNGGLLSTASIRLERESHLLSMFSRDAELCLVTALPVGMKIGHYEDDGLKFDENDRHGQPLTFTTSERLQFLRDANNFGEWNRAAIAFMLALPPGTRIILYWC